MKTISIIFAIIIFLLLTLAGCGLVSLSIYSKSTNTVGPTYFEGYYGANWTASGHIITAKRETTVKLGGDPDGGDEIISERQLINKIDYINLTETLISEISVRHELLQVSKSGMSNTFAYITHFTGSSEKNLSIYYESSLSKNFDIVKTGTDYLSFNSANSYFLLSQTSRFKVYNLNGTIHRDIITGGSAIWKDNDEIYFHNDSSGKVNLYNIISGETSEINSTLSPEGYNPDDNTLLQLIDTTLYSFDMSTFRLNIRYISYNYQKLNEHHFSPDGTKILFTKKGYYDRFAGGFNEEPSFGIYVYDLETDELIKVRD